MRGTKNTRAMRGRAGSAAVLAMVYLVLMSVLAMAMAAVASLNIRTASNHSDVERARASAETGLRWMGWRFCQLSLPQTDVGTMTDAVALTLWPTLKTTIKSDLAAMSPAPAVVDDSAGLHVGPMTGPDGATFKLDIWQTPGAERIVQIKATGLARDARRALSMEFFLQKTMKYGVISRIPIQLGKNTTVDGDICMASLPKDSQPPVLAISDFRYTSGTVTPTALDTQVSALQAYLGTHNAAHDNRLPADAATLAAVRASSGALSTISDYNHDGYIDETDLFQKYFDNNADARVSQAEFTSKAPNDPNLFRMLDEWTRPWSTDPAPASYLDGYADLNDQYAKVRGHIRVLETEASLTSRLAANSQKIADVIQGPVSPADTTSPAVEFNATDLTGYAMQPSDFNMTSFLNLSGPRSGATETHPLTAATADATREFDNTKISKTDFNGTKSATNINKLTAGGSTLVYTGSTVTSVTENVPYGSTTATRRSTVTRPVFSNMTFNNVVISKGTNALFLNCVFNGVTFVDGTYNMGTSYSNGNNLRFESCSFTGPIAQGDTATSGHIGEAPNAYTDYTNSWEFTGATGFDLSVAANDTSPLAVIKKQATIMAPRTNIEMGSFTAPGQATCSFQGVVVAGCFDVRGIADIDGTIIVADTAAGNCTLGYFGANDNATNSGQPDPSMVTGSYGKIHIRFNPFRSLPNGINMRVTLLPDTTSWREVTP